MRRHNASVIIKSMSEIVTTESYGAITEPRQMAIIMSMSVRGDSVKTIQRILKEKFDVEYPLRTIVNFRKRNKAALGIMRDASLNTEFSRADNILDDSLRRIKRRYSKADDDEPELEALEEEYRNGEIDYSEYKRRRTGLIRLSPSELITNAKEASNITQKARKSALPPSAPGDKDDGSEDMSELDLSMASALLEAINRGDTVSLMKIQPNE